MVEMRNTPVEILIFIKISPEALVIYMQKEFRVTNSIVDKEGKNITVGKMNPDELQNRDVKFLMKFFRVLKITT